MNVEVVTIGDELLLGFTIDTNAAHLARTLAAAGIGISRRSTAGDAAADIAQAVREALDRTGAVITTGGLGPTSDDLTKPSIAALFGRAMEFDEAVWEALKARWKSFRWPGEIPESNRQQAYIPQGATILPNRHGSAPGIWIEDDRGRWVAMLPGVPREMRGMLADELLPRILARAYPSDGARATGAVIASRTLRTVGIGESALADKLGPIAREAAGLALAYLPGWEGVDIRLTSRGKSAPDARRALDASADALRAIAGEYIYGEDNTDLAETLLNTLRERGMTLAVAESCTGGMLGARLTAIPGSSAVVRGGVMAYADDVKRALLGVSEATLAAHGAVSEETAREMAAGGRARLGSDACLSITGTAGPGGGTEEKPVGTVCIAVDVRGAQRSARLSVIGDRDEIRRRSTQAVLNMLRNALASPIVGRL